MLLAACGVFMLVQGRGDQLCEGPFCFFWVGDVVLLTAPPGATSGWLHAFSTSCSCLCVCGASTG